MFWLYSNTVPCLWAIEELCGAAAPLAKANRVLWHLCEAAPEGMKQSKNKFKIVFGHPL